MRVLIVGEGKSGTTALLRSVSDALGEPAEIFEPTLMTPDDLTPDPLVVKKLLLNWKADENDLLDSFDKRVQIVRDPRDRLISHLLYDAYNKADQLTEEQRLKWLNLLQRKVEKPRSISVIHLINAWWRLSRSDLTSHYVRAIDRSTGFNRRLGDQFHTVRYEDYVDGDFESLNAYLGLHLGAGVVKDSEARVARSSTHGEWRRWFTRPDIHVFRPVSHEWLRKNGYVHSDWAFDRSNEPLNLETTVDYVARLFSQKPPRKERKRTQKAGQGKTDTG